MRQRFLIGLMAIVLASAGSVRADDGEVIAWEDLNQPAQRFFIEQAEHFVSIDGQLWSREVLDRADRVMRTAQQAEMYGPCWALADAPLLYNLATGERWAGSDRDFERFLWAMQVRKNAALGIVPLRGRISQITDGGSLARVNEQLVFIDGAVAGVDGAAFSGWGRSVGRYRYVSVSGAARTVERYELVDEPEQIAIEPTITGQQLYEYCMANGIEAIPYFVPQRRTVQPARVRDNVSGSGPIVRRQTVRVSDPVFEYSWEERSRWPRIAPAR